MLAVVVAVEVVVMVVVKVVLGGKGVVTTERCAPHQALYGVFHSILLPLQPARGPGLQSSAADAPDQSEASSFSFLSP